MAAGNVTHPASLPVTTGSLQASCAGPFGLGSGVTVAPGDGGIVADGEGDECAAEIFSAPQALRSPASNRVVAWPSLRSMLDPTRLGDARLPLIFHKRLDRFTLPYNQRSHGKHPIGEEACPGIAAEAQPKPRHAVGGEDADHSCSPARGRHGFPHQ